MLDRFVKAVSDDRTLVRCALFHSACYDVYFQTQAMRGRTGSPHPDLGRPLLLVIKPFPVTF